MLITHKWQDSCICLYDYWQDKSISVLVRDMFDNPIGSEEYPAGTDLAVIVDEVTKKYNKFCIGATRSYFLGINDSDEDIK